MSSSRGKKAVVPASKKMKGASSSSGPTAEICHPFLQLPIGSQEELFQILWARPLENALTPGVASYNPSHSKASALPPSLRYLHAILAHTLTGRCPHSMRVIEKRRGTFPPQYRLAQSTEEEAPEDITDDVPPRPKDPPSQPPPPSRLVHAAASYPNISERLT
ncbi:hypothetical protein GOBAR_AA03325 [Gossypium barbadense]|uniref:Uncharacterized protein n=1 Tax=Gossypium barbadense TaxID=3634 RepID=A0A2P5YNV4_GOSBA|nr:hypothetical protein GOBAR_AA03325 [Gossypium barbadense]